MAAECWCDVSYKRAKVEQNKINFSWKWMMCERAFMWIFRECRIPHEKWSIDFHHRICGGKSLLAYIYNILHVDIRIHVPIHIISTKLCCALYYTTQLRIYLYIFTIWSISEYNVDSLTQIDCGAKSSSTFHSVRLIFMTVDSFHCIARVCVPCTLYLPFTVSLLPTPNTHHTINLQITVIFFNISTQAAWKSKVKAKEEIEFDFLVMRNFILIFSTFHGEYIKYDKTHKYVYVSWEVEDIVAATAIYLSIRRHRRRATYHISIFFSSSSFRFGLFQCAQHSSISIRRFERSK